MLPVPDVNSLFQDLPAPLRREVLWRVGSIALIFGGAILLLGLILLLALTLGNQSPQAYRAGLSLGLILLAFAAALIAGVYLLILGTGAWPGVLGARRLGELYGLTKDDLSNARLRSRMRTTAYWWHSLAGLVLVSGSLAILAHFFTMVTGRPFARDNPFIILGPGLLGYGIAVRAWWIRRLVADRRSSKPLDETPDQLS